MTPNLEQLTVTRFRVEVELAEPTPWSPLVAWVVAGAFGAAVESDPELKGALFKTGDAHPILFETTPSDGVQDMAAFTKSFPPDAGPFSVHDLAHHIVIAYARHVAFDLLFIGDAARHAQRALGALWRLQETGLGRYRYATESRVPFRIVRVAHLDAAGSETNLIVVAPPNRLSRVENMDFGSFPPTFTLEEAFGRAASLAKEPHLRIELLTPLLLRRTVRDESRGEQKVAEQEPTLLSLVSKARRRVLDLLSRYPDPRFADRPVVEAPRFELPDSCDERWSYRYWIDEDVSSLSQSERRIRGVVGSLSVPTPPFESLLFLTLVEQIHLGKDAIRGMGRMRLVSERLPTNDSLVR
ncbi:hypothetical protein FJZ36_13565 [Candidatus Poribacteria bacterium]|nr:hypothetical protein [Candidatus Poribacteria bacterium]